jgi:cysteine desulfurase
VIWDAHDHQSSVVELRERFFVDESETDQALAERAAFTSTKRRSRCELIGPQNPRMEEQRPGKIGHGLPMFDVFAVRVKVRCLSTRIYLDHNATTPLADDVRTAMTSVLAGPFGNPSSLHAEGRAARQLVEAARDAVAALVGAAREEIVFTSGGTEGDNLAVRGLAEAARAADPRRVEVVTSALEHPAVTAAAAALGERGFVVKHVHVDSAGAIDGDDFQRLVGERTALVTLQLANHELGTVNPIAELGARARACGALVHTDAVQALGKLAIDVRTLGVDAATLSAHKIYGPKGAGALYLAGGRALPALLVGGHQERERRPGTENVAGVVGFAAAARLAAANLAEWSAHTARLRDRLEAGALALGARRNGGGPRVPNTANLAFAGVDGELVMANLDLAGVAVSTGAACSSGSLEPSPVLLGLGQPPTVAREAVRFSLGWQNMSAEVDRVLELLPEILARIRRATTRA